MRKERNRKGSSGRTGEWNETMKIKTGMKLIWKQ
jgi:hypothetical protein